MQHLTILGSPSRWSVAAQCTPPETPALDVRAADAIAGNEVNDERTVSPHRCFAYDGYGFLNRFSQKFDW